MANSDAETHRMLKRLVGRVGPANRQAVERGIQYRLNKGLRPSSVYNWARAVEKADAFFDAPLHEASAEASSCIFDPRQGFPPRGGAVSPSAEVTTFRRRAFHIS